MRSSVFNCISTSFCLSLFRYRCEVACRPTININTTANFVQAKQPANGCIRVNEYTYKYLNKLNFCWSNEGRRIRRGQFSIPSRTQHTLTTKSDNDGETFILHIDRCIRIVDKRMHTRTLGQTSLIALSAAKTRHTHSHTYTQRIVQVLRLTSGVEETQPRIVAGTFVPSFYRHRLLKYAHKMHPKYGWSCGKFCLVNVFAYLCKSKVFRCDLRVCPHLVYILCDVRVCTRFLVRRSFIWCVRVLDGFRFFSFPQKRI